MRPGLDIDKLNRLPRMNDAINTEYGVKGTPKRMDFDAKSLIWYYSDIVKRHRKSVGITQKQLAEKIGVSPRYVSQFERGEVEITLTTFIQLTEAIGLRFAPILY